MASGQRIVVDIIGNDSSFQAALARSQASAAKFGSSVSRSLGGGGVSVAAQFDPLLARVKETKARSDELSQRLQNLDDGFQDTAGGARQLSGGLLPMIGRVGLVTFGINAAYQASRHLSDALKTTGNEAFTTGGKLRNFGSALLSGDLVGGIEALKATPKTFDDLGISVNRARNILDGLSQSGVKLKDLPPVVQDLVDSMQSVVAAQDAAQNSADALADSYARVGQVFRDVTGQAVLFKGAVDDLGGPRGPGAVDQINAALELERAGRFGAGPQRPLGPSSRNANALIVAQANQDLDEVLRLQTVQRDKLAKAIENSHGNVKQRQELARNYALAVAAVATTQQQIKAQNDAEAKAAADAANQARSDRWGKIIGALDIGVTRAQLTKTLGDDLARLQDLKAGLERQIRAGVDVASAQSRLAQTEVTIAGKQQEIRAAAAAAVQAQQFRALGLSVTGEAVVPGIDNLRKRISTALQKFDSGDANIGAKLVKQLRLARTLIVKEGDDLTRVTRDKINQILKAAEGGDQLPSFRVPNFSDKFKNLGLSPQQLIAIRSAFSRIGPGGLIPQFTATGGAFGLAGGTNVASPTVVNVGTVVTNDPEKFIRDMQRQAQRTTRARTGPASGRGL